MTPRVSTLGPRVAVALWVRSLSLSTLERLDFLTRELLPSSGLPDTIIYCTVKGVDSSTQLVPALLSFCSDLSADHDEAEYDTSRFSLFSKYTSLKMLTVFAPGLFCSRVFSAAFVS